MNDPDPRHMPHGFDNDAIFAEIVAHLNDEVAEPEPGAGPQDQDAVATDNGAVDEAPADTPSADKCSHIDQPPGLSTPGQPQALPTPRLPTPQALPAPQVWRAHEMDDDYEEHFEPRPVDPLPVGDLQFWAILVGMGGGPLLLLYLVFFNPDASTYLVLAAIAMSVGGFALLVSRLPGNPGDDDDGARL